jgi:hypothetical protein
MGDNIYTLEQQVALGKRLKQEMINKRWKSNREFAVFSGVGHTAVGSLLRGPTDQTTFQLLVQVSLALDIDIYTVIRDLGLDAHVRNRMREEDYRSYFTNLWWMKAESPPKGNPLSPIEQIVNSLPEKNQKMGRRMLINLVAELSEE